MAVEAKRGCGYRVVGGIYLVSGPGGFSCGRLPVPLLPCPLCDHSPGFIRGIRRCVPKNFLHAAHDCTRALSPQARDAAKEIGIAPACSQCPFDRAFQADDGAMMWVGDKFYTPQSFTEEAATLGPSKRISAVPKWFKLGMWVFLAHEQVIEKPCPACAALTGTVPMLLVIENCEECGGAGIVKTPAIFYAFRPTRIEKVIRKSTSEEVRKDLEERGYTLVEVPDGDRDHHSRKGSDEE